MSKQWQAMPSEIYFIEDELAAWCFNRAVSLFGTSVDGAIQEAVQGAKNDAQARQKAHRTLLKWLDKDDTVGVFKDPAKGGGVK